MYFRRSVVFFLVTVFFIFQTQSKAFAAATGGASSVGSAPVVLTGGDLPDIAGSEIGKIGVFAYRDGLWSPVPFQVDERRSKGKKDGAVYVFPPEKDTDPKFDGDDELVVMAKDFGSKAPGTSGVEVAPGMAAKAVSEIEAQVAGGTVYVYVMVFDSTPPRGDVDYVSWDGEKRRVVSRGAYEVGYPENDPFFFDDLTIPDENDGNGRDFVDTFKFRANGRVIAQLFIYDITNDDWRNSLVGVIDGPVRVIRRLRVRINSTVFRIHINTVDVVYYPDYFTMDVPVPMGMMFSWYYQADARMSLDLADDAPPMVFFNENNAPAPGVVADGNLSEEEKKLDLRPTKWICLAGRAGNVAMRLDQREGSRAYQDIYYRDDVKAIDGPENYPGARGDSGFSMARIDRSKSVARVFTVTFAFPSTAKKDKVERAMSVFDSPISAKVTGGAQLAGRAATGLATDDREQPPAHTYMAPGASERTRAYLPQLLIDPNLGYGSGFQVVERDTFGIGLSSDFIFLLSHRLYQSYRLEEIYKNFGPISEARLYIHYLLHPNRYFYGIGNDQTPDDLAVFSQERFISYVQIKRDITDWLKLTARYQISHQSIGHGELQTGDEPSIEEKYGPDEWIVGKRFGEEVYGQAGGYTSSIEVDLGFDFRDDELYPTKGMYHIFSVKHCAPWLGSDYEFNQYRADFRFYYSGLLVNPEKNMPGKLWLRNFIGSQTDRVFAMRLVGQRTDAPVIDFAGRRIKDVPFFEMSYLGDADSSRGHYWAQWVDNDVTFAMFEMRWRMFKIIDATVFYDVGRVWENINSADQWDDAEFSDLHSSYGFGFRFNMVAGIVMRLDYGFSEENPGGLMYIEGFHTF